MSNTIVGTILICLGLYLYGRGIAENAPPKQTTVSMSDLPTGQYQIDYSTSEVTISKDGIVKKRYLKQEAE